MDPDFLADKKNIGRVQDLLSHVGYNWWSDMPFQLCAFAIRFIANGRQVPDTKEELMTYKGFGRHLAVLTLQDAFGYKKCGIVVDCNVRNVVWDLEWTERVTLEAIAKELESWLGSEHFDDVNTVFAGARQLAKDTSEDGGNFGDEMKAFAFQLEKKYRKRGLAKLIRTVIDA